MKKVLGTVVLLVLTAVAAIGGWQFYQKQNRIIVIFDEAKGLKPGAIVQMDGIDIGTVRALSLGRDGIDVSIQLDPEAKKRLTTTALFVINPDPGGGQAPQVMVKDGPPGGKPLAAQARIRGVNSLVLWQLRDLSTQIEQMMDSPAVRDFTLHLQQFEKEMEEAIRNLHDAATEQKLEQKIAQLSREFEQVLHEADAKKKLEEISMTIARLRTAVARIGDSEEAKRLRQALDDLGRRVQEELAAQK